jgi:hypothetical protein
MNAFHDLAEMTRDYGLIRYFVMTIIAATALMVVLFVWGHSTDDAAAPPLLSPAPAQSSAPSSY